MTSRIPALLFAALVFAAPLENRAEELPPVAGVLAKIESADPGVQTYSARVEFSVGLHSFPYLRKTVHGETYFKRPNRMEIVFSDLPPYAARFKNVFVALGSPKEWERKFDISLVALTSAGAELKLVPKSGDTRRLREVHVFIDEQASLPNRMLWLYRDGGAIDMTQTFTQVNGHYLVESQSAEMHMHGMSAWAHTRIDQYALNVAIDEAVFTPKKQGQ